MSLKSEVESAFPVIWRERGQSKEVGVSLRALEYKTGLLIPARTFWRPPHGLDISCDLSSFFFLIVQAPYPSLHLLCNLRALLPGPGLPVQLFSPLLLCREVLLQDHILHLPDTSTAVTNFRMCHKPLPTGFHITALYELAHICCLTL